MARGVAPNPDLPPDQRVRAALLLIHEIQLPAGRARDLRSSAGQVLEVDDRCGARADRIAMAEGLALGGNLASVDDEQVLRRLRLHHRSATVFEADREMTRSE